MKINLLLLPATVLALWAQTSAHAQSLIQTSATAPTPGANDIFYFGGNAAATFDLDGNTDYSNNVPAPGETFTTAVSALGFNLRSVTVQGGGDAGTDGATPGVDYQAANYTLTLYSVAAGVATQRATQTYRFASATADYSTNFLTFTLTTPLQLAGGTQYAFSLSASAGFYGFNGTAPTAFGGTGVQTTGGNSVGVAGNGPVTNYAASRNFDVALTPLAAAPEPGAWALSIVGLAGLALMYKRRTAQATA